jgi:hypothetical protein
MEYKKNKPFLLQKFVNKKYIDYMNKKIDNKNKEIEKLIEALFWCSGSQDFEPGGIARNGWVKLCQPLLQKYLDEETFNRHINKNKKYESTN